MLFRKLNASAFLRGGCTHLRVYVICRYRPPIKVQRSVFRLQVAVHNLSAMSVLELTFLRWSSESTSTPTSTLYVALFRTLVPSGTTWKYSSTFLTITYKCYWTSQLHVPPFSAPSCVWEMILVSRGETQFWSIMLDTVARSLSNLKKIPWRLLCPKTIQTTQFIRSIQSLILQLKHYWLKLLPKKEVTS